MIKIEKLLDSGKAVFIREGNETPAFAGQLLNYAEIETLKVLEGSVLYSIDESELVTVKAGEQAPVETEETKSPESAPAVETPTETTETPKEEVTEVKEETPAAPVIVKPAPRKK